MGCDCALAQLRQPRVTDDVANNFDVRAFSRTPEHVSKILQGSWGVLMRISASIMEKIRFCDGDQREHNMVEVNGHARAKKVTTLNLPVRH